MAEAFGWGALGAAAFTAGDWLLDRGGGERKDAAGAQAGGSPLAEAYAVEGVFTGPLVVAGFAVSLALSAV